MEFIKKVMSLKDISSNEKMVLIYLYGNNFGKLKIKDIQLSTSLPKRTITRALFNLEEKGFISQIGFTSSIFVTLTHANLALASEREIFASRQFGASFDKKTQSNDNLALVGIIKMVIVFKWISYIFDKYQEDAVFYYKFGNKIYSGSIYNLIYIYIYINNYIYNNLLRTTACAGKRDRKLKNEDCQLVLEKKDIIELVINKYGMNFLNASKIQSLEMYDIIIEAHLSIDEVEQIFDDATKQCELKTGGIPTSPLWFKNFIINYVRGKNGEQKTAGGNTGRNNIEKMREHIKKLYSN